MDKLRTCVAYRTAMLQVIYELSNKDFVCIREWMIVMESKWEV